MSKEYRIAWKTVGNLVRANPAELYPGAKEKNLEQMFKLAGGIFRILAHNTSDATFHGFTNIARKIRSENK